MEGSPLEAAYAAARKADLATAKKEFKAASEFHIEASKKFTEAKGLTSSMDALRTLEVLSKQHLARSKFLAGQSEALAQIKKEEPIDDDDTASISTVTTTTTSNTSRNSPDPIPSTQKPSDPFGKLYREFNKVCVARTGTQSIIAAPGGSGFANESFYVVPTTSSLSNEELITENAQLRQRLNQLSSQMYSYETAFKKQRELVKAGLSRLKASYDEKDRTIADLKKENEKLNSKVTKLKQRWDGLKESARKRREE
ncbi:hypothetical protein TRVA0_028S00518 [Trichomonascus vanleenenianus]|uniref:Atg38p n=1 Tax=Trichomonascus vanleenenianus TaxID=2268995 RepID=UPI003EC9EAEF